MKFRRPRARRETRLELTPLIDVIFQLLLFFLLTTSFVSEQRLPMELPTADASSEETPDVVVTIELDAAGVAFEQGRRIAYEEIPSVVRRITARAANAVLVVRADRRTRHGSVVEVMDLARSAGLTRFAIVTQPHTPDRGEQHEPRPRR